MKLTESKLKQMINEEINNLDRDNTKRWYRYQIYGHKDMNSEDMFSPLAQTPSEEKALRLAKKYEQDLKYVRIEDTQLKSYYPETTSLTIYNSPAYWEYWEKYSNNDNIKVKKNLSKV